MIIDAETGRHNIAERMAKAFRTTEALNSFMIGNKLWEKYPKLRIASGIDDSECSFYNSIKYIVDSIAKDGQLAPEINKALEQCEMGFGSRVGKAEAPLSLDPSSIAAFERVLDAIPQEVISAYMAKKQSVEQVVN